MAINELDALAFIGGRKIRGRRQTPWTPLRRKLDKYHQNQAPRGRHRKNVSPTHQPAWPFNRRTA